MINILELNFTTMCSYSHLQYVWYAVITWSMKYISQHTYILFSNSKAPISIVVEGSIHIF